MNDVSGLIYLLNQAGQALAAAEAEMARLRTELASATAQPEQ